MMFTPLPFQKARNPSSLQQQHKMNCGYYYGKQGRQVDVSQHGTVQLAKTAQACQETQPAKQGCMHKSLLA
jgi:hypothetical protein